MTPTEFAAWFKDKFGHPLGQGPRTRIHPQQEEAEHRQAERGQDEREWAAYASPREMDAAAADYVYGRGPAGDWRCP